MPELSTQNRSLDFEYQEIIAREWPDQVYLDENGELRERPAKKNYLLGNREHPVSKCREMIVDTISSNLVTVLASGTGTGKSTNIPQFLFESGLFNRVYVTQPRIVAARELKTYVSNEVAISLNDREHNLVGYETAAEAESSDDSAIVYITDGLQLMREITDKGTRGDEILILDEHHERNKNMDALLAIALEKGIRVLIMSATLDVERLRTYCEESTGQKVPIIDIKGVNHEIEERESGDLDGEIIAAAKEGKNILVFLPGRQEITSVMSRMRRKVPKAYTLLALHGDQTPDEQRRVFPSYPGGKIIFSTRVGQTSITIPDIDVVVDCGYDRSDVLTEYGGQMLAIEPSSRASADQRRGRAGRTKSGEYVRAQLRGYPQLPLLDEIAQYDTPDIKRTRTDDLQLKMAAYGRNVADMPFYDFPEEGQLEKGSERLERLGFFRKLGGAAIKGYEITEMGERAAMLPLDANSARMVIESRAYGTAVELQMMAAVVVQQLNGITSTVKGSDKWRRVTEEADSDVIAGIDFMVAAMHRSAAERERINIVELRYRKAFRAFEQLARRRNLDIYELMAPSSEQRRQLLACIIAGTDEVFVRAGQTRAGRVTYRDNDGKKRMALASSVMTGNSNLIVGSRFDLQQVRNRKIVTHSLINHATSVTAMDLLELGTQNRVNTTINSMKIDPSGQAHTTETVVYDRHSTRQSVERVGQASEALHAFIIEQIFSTGDLAAELPPNIAKAREIIREFRKLQHKTKEDLGIDEEVQRIINRMMKESAYNSRSLSDIDPFVDISAIQDIIPEFIREEINAHSPNVITIVDQGRAHHLPVEYFPESDRAHITVAERYYTLLPFTIGDHRLSVRPNSKTQYLPLEKAKYIFEQPSRSERRNTSKATPQPETAIPGGVLHIRRTPSGSRIPPQHRGHASRYK